MSDSDSDSESDSGCLSSISRCLSSISRFMPYAKIIGKAVMITLAVQTVLEILYNLGELKHQVHCSPQGDGTKTLCNELASTISASDDNGWQCIPSVTI